MTKNANESMFWSFVFSSAFGYKKSGRETAYKACVWTHQKRSFLVKKALSVGKSRFYLPENVLAYNFRELSAGPHAVSLISMRQDPRKN